MTDLAAARSFLFVPATRPDRIAKARASGADAVVVDLEDAVAPADKSRARDGLARALDPDHPVVLRVNAAGTDWHADDLALAARPGVSAILLAKAETPSAVAALSRPAIPLVESAAGLAAAAALAGVPGVVRLAFGTIDAMHDLGLPEDGAALDVYRARLCLVSRVAGISPPIDGVTTATGDPEAAHRDTRRAAAFGFTARLAIHPDQIAPIHEAFRPSEAEVARARRILAAAEGGDGGAKRLDGEMIDAPVIARARALLDRL